MARFSMDMFVDETGVTIHLSNGDRLRISQLSRDEGAGVKVTLEGDRMPWLDAVGTATNAMMLKSLGRGGKG